MCLGIYAALHALIRPDADLKVSMCVTFLSKIQKLKSDINVNDLSLRSIYGNFMAKPKTEIKFPNELDIILAHSMTPLPKKMIQGKR